jgi:hypothetical protein
VSGDMFQAAEWVEKARDFVATLRPKVEKKA